MVETMALKEMQCAHCNVFACDVLESCKTFMTNNFPVQQWLSDVHCPEHARLPPVDLYVAGWCCQPFSLQGRQHGLEDARSDTIWPIITYVQTAKPKLVMLENVANIMSQRHAAGLAKVLDHLTKIQNGDGRATYTWAMRVLNTKNFGLPQQRRRLYIVGIRNDLGKSVVWPDPLPKVGLDMIYDKNHRRQPITDHSHNGATAKTNIERCLAQINDAGLQPHDRDFVIDIGGGRGSILHYNHMPTITRTRGSALAYVLTKYGTRISLAELMRCQGFRPERLQLEGLSVGAVGAMVGNAMSVNVVMHILRVNLPSLGIHLG